MPDLVASIAAHPRRRVRTVIGVRPQVVLARSNAFPAVAHCNADRPLARSNAVPPARSNALAGRNIAARGVLLAVRNAPHCKTSLVRSRLRLQQPLKLLPMQQFGQQEWRFGSWLRPHSDSIMSLLLAYIAAQLRPLAVLDQEQKPERTSGEAGSGRRLGSLMPRKRHPAVSQRG